MSKRQWLIIGTAVVFLAAVAGAAFFHIRIGSAAGEGNAAGLPVEGNIRLVPVYNLQGQPMYVNASVTPLLFFATWCPHCQAELPQVQTELAAMRPQRPVVLVATFLRTSDTKEAIKEVQDFISKYHITMPVVIQAGPATEYVQKVPTLVWADATVHQVDPTEANLKLAVSHG